MSGRILKLTMPLWLMWLMLLCSVASAQQQVQLHTRDGDLVMALLPDSSIRFTVVDSLKSESRQVSWNEVASLQLVEFQMAQQTEQIEELLQQLADADYQKREQAEALLSDAEKFGPLEAIIKDMAKSPKDIEVKYRLKRVLNALEEYNGPAVGSFDEIRLKSGELLRGDVGDFAPVTDLFGKQIRFSRKNLLQVVTADEQLQNSERKTLEITTYNQPFPNFYKNEDELISFENVKNGEPTPLGENAAEMFASDGLLFRTEDAGYVGTLWYPFKLCLIEPGKKCICPFDETALVAKRLWGTTLITFCSPGQPNVSAGVKKFGLFLEKIDHSRDVVVEAYNAAGQMVGMVEASDQKCVFAGFESNELITCVRISKNAHLTKLSRRIDPSYAIDCVTYADLQPTQALYDPVPGSAAAIQIKLGLANGNKLNVTQLSVDEQRLSFQCGLSGEATCSVDEVSFLNYNRSRRFAASENDYLMVQLVDSSIVKTEIDNWNQPFDFFETVIGEDQITGIWSGRQPARLPLSVDFESSKPVIVFPSCRIIAEGLKLSGNGLSWDGARSNKLIQEVKLFEKDRSRVTREESQDPDLTPAVSDIAFRSSPKIPTLWLQPPQTLDTSRGHVFLTDGQYFALGDNSRFKVTHIGSRNIEIEFGKSKKLYPFTRISSIKLPSKSLSN